MPNRTRGETMARKRVGVIDILVDAPVTSALGRLYSAYFRKQFTAIMPQAVSVWCRQMGHEVYYTTYFGVGDPRERLPKDLDVVFVATYTQASLLAYSLAKRFRAEGVTTVIGGPHARSFPKDSERFFDIVVLDCDKALIDDIVSGRIDAPGTVTSGRPLTSFPSVEERMPEIKQSAFVRGKPIFMSVVPMLSSIGCPYTCNFCIDWNTDYVPFAGDQLAADLQYLGDNYSKMIVAFHDPNFGVRFDETMDVMEKVTPGSRPGYIMESSLSILKEDRLHRLRDTNCVYVAPGVESWGEYSNKAGALGKAGQAKLDQVVGHFETLGSYVPGMQANFLFGGDDDRGSEPVELTKDFIRRLPLVWPTINIPTPFAGTPLTDQLVAEGRVLKTLPFAFYYNPYLAITIKNYDPKTYYEHLIDMHELIVSRKVWMGRLLKRSRPAIRFIHSLRTFAARVELNDFRRLRAKLDEDAQFRAYHEGEAVPLPEYYRAELRRRMGAYADLLTDAEITPSWEEAPASGAPAVRNFGAPIAAAE